jgi:hypothetical protein
MGHRCDRSRWSLSEPANSRAFYADWRVRSPLGSTSHYLPGYNAALRHEAVNSGNIVIRTAAHGMHHPKSPITGSRAQSCTASVQSPSYSYLSQRIGFRTGPELKEAMHIPVPLEYPFGEHTNHVLSESRKGYGVLT